MKHRYFYALTLGLIMGGATACSSPSQSDTSSQDVSVAATAPLTTPLDGIFYDTVCTYQDGNGQTQHVEYHEFVNMHQGTAPGSMLSGDAGPGHAFADFFTTIPVPATCEVTATAGNLDQSGTFVASDECEPAHTTFNVTAEHTTEVVMTIQCKGDETGAGDEVVVVNEGPTIASIDLDKFVCVNAPREITATVTDPEGDETTCQWDVISAPAGATGTMTPTVTTDPPGHTSTFQGNTIGDYEVTLTCTDAMNGIPSTLQFPMHVIDCGCVCPEGYQPGPAGDGCVATYTVPAIQSSTVYSVCAAKDNRNYSYLGAEYPNGTLSPNDAPSDYWGTGSWSQSVDPNARLNAVGVWACDPHVTPGGGTFPMTDPINEWIGFVSCVNVPQSGEYLVGLGADNEMRVKVNGTIMFNWDQPDISNFTSWHIRKIHLDSGVNLVSVEGLNVGEVAAFGAEISGPFPSGSLNTDAAMMAADFDGHKIFSTADVIGQNFTIGENSGFHCQPGFTYNACSAEPECTFVSHIPCGDKSVCCESKSLPHLHAFLSPAACTSVHGHEVPVANCN